MRISPVSQNNNQSFGMARLTKRGQELVQNFLSDVPEFVDSRCYLKKNLIKPLLKNASTTPQDVVDFFRPANTVYSTMNEMFIKKQIDNRGAMGVIKRFLQKESQVAEDGTVTLTEKARSLVDSILHTFDTNVTNPEVSAAQGAKMLNLIEPYVSTETLANRTSVVSSSIFSIR